MSIIRTHTKRWESVPRAAFEDLRLSLEARGLLGWLLTRPGNWSVRVAPMLALTGTSKRRWPRIRDELAAVGYLEITRTKAPDGKIIWLFDVYSQPSRKLKQ